MKKFLASATIALGCFVSHSAMAQDITASTGVDYSEGDFGTGVDTTILVVPFSLRANFEGFSLTATIPYLQIDGSRSVIGGGEGPIVTDPDATAVKRSGVGDVNLRASVDLIDLAAVELSANGRVKIPVGSTSNGLSTGKADFAAALNWLQRRARSNLLAKSDIAFSATRRVLIFKTASTVLQERLFSFPLIWLE